MLVEFVLVHRLRQIIGFLHDARVTNPLDHMSAACQPRASTAKGQSYAGQENRHTVHPHVSSHWAFAFFVL